MTRIAARNSAAYTIGMPQIMFSPVPPTGNLNMWVDWRALASAFFGITNSDGKVLNSKGKIVGTPDDIMAQCYLGSLDSVTAGGDVETLEHTISNRGYEEVDRVAVLQRKVEYSLNFDEPDIKNLSRYFVGEETNLGMSLEPLEVAGKTFVGSGNSAVTIVENRIGDPAKAMETIIGTWQSNNNKTNMPPNGTYAFIVGGTNEEECVGAWQHKRQYIAYADFDFTTQTVGQWAYIRPKGTAENSMYGASPLVEINNTVHSIIDSVPMVTSCNTAPEWNVNAMRAFTGFGYEDCDEGFFGFGVLSTRRSFHRTAGAALVVTLTDIGTTTVHMVPKCTLLPEGSMSFNADAWMQGSFTMSVERDNSAVMLDRSPALPIPFGYLQSLETLSG